MRPKILSMAYTIDLTKITQFDHVEFVAKQVVEGFITGIHKSPMHGFSVEFAEHRPYNTGEPIRHIDWKLYARTDKLFVKQYEEETWKATKASKKLDAYENFIKEHPKGYYANEARNIIAKTKMEQNKNVKPSFTEFKRAGDYSHPGYSLIYFGNADNKQRVLTFSMTGPTGYSESIRADDLKWVRVKNGTYEVLIQGTKDEIIRGSVTVENGIYYKVLWTGNNQNKETTDKMLNVIVDKVEEEKMYIEGAK